MVDRGLDIRGEVARLHRELVSFRDDCLPALINSAGPAGYADDLARPLRHWQGAVDRLLDALPSTETGGKPPPPDPVAFAEYLFQPVTASSHVVRDGRIAWRIELAVGWDTAAMDVLYRPTAGRVAPANPVEGLRRDLPEARRWIMSRPVDGSDLWHLITVGLVPIADQDPAFAKLALDPETWRAVVLADRGIDEEIKVRGLAMVDGVFRRVLNNALLHVIGALACNHFESILGLLDHPDLPGGSYTTMMPHYLFAVLYEKVRVLHEMIRAG